MTRSKKMFLNIIWGMLYQVVTVICNFILPRFFISAYGSEVNGLVSSINQFMLLITLCECGIGAVVQSAMYKPLADKDDKFLSQIIVSANRFFRKIIYILISYTIVLVAIYPFISNSSFDFLYTSGLIIILSFSYFVQHYVFLTYKMLLSADQLAFLHLMLHSVVLIINTVVSVILIKMNCSVHIVKLVSSFIFLLQPVILKMYVDRKYNINLKVKLDGEPIRQKWNGFAQHIATVVLNNTATVILTMFSTLSNVSIYSVYFLVVHGIKSLLNSMLSGIQAMFGNMYAKNEIKELTDSFNLTTWLFNLVVIIVYVTAGIVLVPFVSVYTKGITDADYIQPLFSFLMTLAFAMYCIRIPYNLLVFAAGRYKETQLSSIIEAILNIIVSVVLVKFYGLCGVAIGTFVAMFYRTTYFAYYLSKHIIKQSVKEYYKFLFVDVVIALLSVLATMKISLGELSYVSWVVMSLKVGFITLGISLAVNFIFYRKMFVEIKKYILSKIRR